MIEQNCPVTDKEREALDILQEECAEVIQIISKIERFGLESFNPYDPYKRTNRELLEEELGHVQAMVKILTEKMKIIDDVYIDESHARKILKLYTFSNIFKEEEKCTS